MEKEVGAMVEKEVVVVVVAVVVMGVAVAAVVVVMVVAVVVDMEILVVVDMGAEVSNLFKFKSLNNNFKEIFSLNIKDTEDLVAVDMEAIIVDELL